LDHPIVPRPPLIIHHRITELYKIPGKPETAGMHLTNTEVVEVME
jgi:hypothetical protein